MEYTYTIGSYMLIMDQFVLLFQQCKNIEHTKLIK